MIFGYRRCKEALFLVKSLANKSQFIFQGLCFKTGRMTEIQIRGKDCKLFLRDLSKKKKKKKKQQQHQNNMAAFYKLSGNAFKKHYGLGTTCRSTLKTCDKIHKKKFN